jgi:hypothetical protein
MSPERTLGSTISTCDSSSLRIDGLATKFLQDPGLFEFCQVIDIILFGRLKEFEKYFARDQAEDRKVDHILRIVRADKAPSVRPNRHFYFASHEERIGRVWDCGEIWSGDRVSARRRNQRWKWW